MFNWIDWVIIAAAAFYVVEGWEQGVLRLGSSLAAFAAALWLAVKYHAAVGVWLVAKFGVPPAWNNVMGFAAVAIVTEVAMGEIIAVGLARLPQKVGQSAVNRGLGAVFSAAKGLVLVAFGLLLVLVLPIRGTVRADIRQSLLGGWMVEKIELYTPTFKSSLDQSTRQAIRFLTIRPTSSERLELPVAAPAEQLTVDPVAEARMIELVNAERIRAGVKPLVGDAQIAVVARSHSREMFERQYFSHISPDGRDAADRLETGGVKFTLAGENLAYAPDVETAHQGLMDSEGHRKNILSPDFTRIGIGIINGGNYGLMVTQNFTD